MKTLKTSPIKLGLLAPLSGIVEIYGQEISWAAEIATSIINKNGGILGRPLELVIADDGSIPEKAVPAAKNLITIDKCDAIIGNLLSNSRISVAYQVAEHLKVPMLNFSFYEGSISSPYYFNFSALPNQQINKMIPYMKSKAGSKMFFSGSDYEWPRGSIDAAKKALIKAGGEVVGEEYYPMGKADFYQLLGAVSRSGADVFVPYFAGTEQINLLKHFTKMGLKSKMSVVMGHYDEVMVSHLSENVRADFYSSNSYFMGVDTDKNKEYLKLLSQREDVTGIWPKGNGVLTNFGEGTYVCVMAYADAVNRAGTLETDKVLEALKHISLQAPQGMVEMNPYNQHAMVNSHLSRCRKNGSFEIIETFEPEMPQIPSIYSKGSPVGQTVSTIVQKEKGVAPDINLDRVLSLSNGRMDDDVVTEFFSQILDVVDVGLVAIDINGIIVHVNQHTEYMFGYEKGEIIGQSISILIPPKYKEAHGHHIKNFFKSANHTATMGKRAEIFGYRKDGRQFPAEAGLAKYKIGGETYFTALLRDVSKYKSVEDELKWQATHDDLTMLPNRSTMVERLTNALERKKRSGNEIAALFIDLDEFKLINDNYGHTIGDLLLVATAERLVNVVRGGDTVFRFGGDEFVVLCEQINNKTSPAFLAERIIEELRKPLTIEGIDLFPSCSIGIAFSSNGSTTAKSLLSNADAAMYHAKGSGRDGWMMFNDDIHNKARERLNIANGLRTAEAKKEFFCVFQPIVSTYSGKIKGVEILMRWKMDGKLVPPDVFIPVAELTGSIREMGSWVFEQACIAQVELAEQSLMQNSPYVSVNVSPKELEQDDYFENICRIYKSTKANPNKIIIEVTETALMEDVEHNLQLLQALSDEGFRISIDDFGTGYSSLSHLTRMPLAILKVDRAFVSKLLTSKTDLTVAKAVVGLAHSLNLEVVAEGVEEIEQREILSELDVDYCQGYYFARPMPLEEIMKASDQY